MPALLRHSKAQGILRDNVIADDKNVSDNFALIRKSSLLETTQLHEYLSNDTIYHN